ncbi:alpha/beta fold hydrolase [Kitasatospora sp. NPDC057015]|uniref:alpha/beta fold hydrolase n=1 Tax=Kitasatospora sp. NPDC057015 TaxID=3346001 RepID=UPI003632CEF7
MNNVEELKQYSGVHAKGLDITDGDRLLERITHDGSGPGSWVGEWAAEGDRLQAQGRHLDASRRYLMARFPYVDGAARQDAYEKSLGSFEQWRTGKGIHRLDVDLDGKQIGCWTTALSTTDRRPLLVIMGGHLTLKEQWAPALPVFARMGVAVVCTELPGVGENEAPYDADGWRFLSAVLDALADRADVTRTIALAMSFSGHLALRCAMEDERIRGIITVGAPVHDFFTDPDWQRELPRVTVDTLAHLTGSDTVEAGRALPVAGLAALDIPVAYVASRRDEVIPQSDPATLVRHVRDLRLLEHDDVHGSPAHVEENKLWMAVQLLDMLGVRNLRSRVIGLMYRLARARGGSRKAG